MLFPFTKIEVVLCEINVEQYWIKITILKNKLNLFVNF